MTHDDPVNLRVESNATWPVAAVSNALIENEVKKQSEGVLTWLLSVRDRIGRSLTVKDAHQVQPNHASSRGVVGN